MIDKFASDVEAIYAEEVRSVVNHIKEYADVWFIAGLADQGENVTILHSSLDRIPCSSISAILQSET